MMTDGKKTYTAAELIGLIRCKYSGNAFAVLEQVASGTGAGADSWIDAAVFSLWPCKGIWRAACEVKVSRADFLDELSCPTKNQWAREHFDFFWYVVAPGVAKDDETPTGCGLMTVRGGRLSIVKQAPRRENVTTDEYIIASFARSLDKERERFVRSSLREAVDTDHRYREAIIWKEGAERYVKSHDDYCHPSTADDVFNKLAELAREKSPETVAADHAIKVLQRFQEIVLNFLLSIAPMAAGLLHARDETGDFIIEKYGGYDEKSLVALKAALKTRGKKRGHGAIQTKLTAEAREVIASELTAATSETDMAQGLGEA